MSRGRPRKWLTNEQLAYAVQIINHFAANPRCVCGSRQFRFGLENSHLRAKCEKCSIDYHYDDEKKSWSRRFR